MLKRILFFLFSLTSILIVIVLLFKTSQDNLSSSLTQTQVSAQANECTATDTANWCQVQHDPQRTGYTPEVLGTNIAISWLYRFWPEKVYPQVQAIIYSGKVFVGTEHGNIYAFDENQSKLQKKAVISWKKTIGSPILASVAAGDNKVFFGALDGAVYALDTVNGNQIWKSRPMQRKGFSTAPVISYKQDGSVDKVMLGGRNGIFYALDPNNGQVLWQRDVGAPIFQTATYNNGKVFFGAMDMYFYALNSSDGSVAWKTPKINAMAFKDYWPVVHQGKVLVRALGKNFYAFDEDTGNETINNLPQFDGKTMNGATAPPCVDRDGYLIIPVPRSDGLWGACWGRLDLATGQISEVLGGGVGVGNGCKNSDESENASSAYNLIIGLHTNEEGFTAGWNGLYNLDGKNWITNIGFLSALDHGPFYNTQGGGGNPASIANGMFYHIGLSYLIARSTQ